MMKKRSTLLICILLGSITVFNTSCCKKKKKAAVNQTQQQSQQIQDNEVTIQVKEGEKPTKNSQIIARIDSLFVSNKFYNPYLEKLEERKRREIEERKRLKEIQRLREEEERKKQQQEKNKVVINKIPTLITKRIEIITPESIIKNIKENFFGVIKVEDECTAIIGEQLIETNNIFEVLDKKNNSHPIIIVDINEKELVVEYMGESYSIKVPTDKEN